MTNNEAAKWIQLYIDLAKIDPSTGEEAYLNEDDRKTLEAMEIARDALTCMDDKKMHDTDDLIRRSDALGCFHDWVDKYGDVHTPDEMAEYRAIEELPSAQPEQAVQEILDYLDTELHPIVSPEHWTVYSDLHDMISTLPTAQQERKMGEWIDYTEDGYVECPFCHSATNCDGNKDELHFCFSCGARMEGKS